MEKSKKYKVEFVLEGNQLHDGFPLIIYHIKAELLGIFNRRTALRFKYNDVCTRVRNLKIKRVLK